MQYVISVANCNVKLIRNVFFFKLFFKSVRFTRCSKMCGQKMLFLCHRLEAHLTAQQSYSNDKAFLMKQNLVRSHTSPPGACGGKKIAAEQFFLWALIIFRFIS